MEPTSTHYIDLISRYFFGEATPDEILELEEWIKTDPANATIFSDFHKTWKTIENDRIGSLIDLDSEWKNLKFEMLDSGSGIRNMSHDIVNRKSKIPHFFFRIAAIFILLLVPSFFLYRYITIPVEKQLTASTEMTVQTLPDGTVVTLNTGATLSYPSRFDGSFRRVTLQGEAWFEVAHDKTKPFLISAGNVRIRVVGTSFFVNTKTRDNREEVILSDGVVRVYFDNRPEKMAVLLPGDKAEMFTDVCTITKSTNEDVNFLAWKTKHIVFSNTPLNEVVALLSKVYDTNIRLAEDNLSDCRITATFDRQSLEPVMNVLKATLDLQVRKTGSGIELSGHGCNQVK